MLALCLSLLLAQTTASTALRTLIDRDWSWRLSEFPQLATSVGAHDADDRLDRVDVVSQERRLQHWRQIAAELAALPKEGVSREERIDAAVLAEQVRAFIEAGEMKAYLFAISGDSSFFSELPQISRQHVFRDAGDYEKYIRRLRDIPRYFDENIELLREGLRTGRTTPQVILKGRDEAAKVHGDVKDPRSSAFYAPFAALPTWIPAEDARRLRAEGEAAIREAVVPAYRKVAAFLAQTYIPAARKSIAASDLPGGREYYRAQIREYVTKEIPPEELHALGLREVARIRAGMERVKSEAGFRGDLGAFLHYLRTAPEFYAGSPEELLMRASFIAKRIDGSLPHFFGLLPRLPYRVEAVPAAIAPFYTGGRYVPAAEGTGEPGTYWVNTYDLKSRPLYVLPALTLHEAVPGHHLQIALAAEQTRRPPFRRHAYFSVYGEGWGLYSEKLGEEMGVYTTPFERFGRLTYEMWRACRLVVDTGIHALGWKRDRALAFMKENTALSEHEIETEVDRYIGWPAQALSYKVGELALRDLRAKAEQQLGPRFDLKKFHDAVLALGSVPLPVLENEIGSAIVSGALAR